VRDKELGVKGLRVRDHDLGFRVQSFGLRV
jgi:hypothetical protein